MKEHVLVRLPRLSFFALPDAQRHALGYLALAYRHYAGLLPHLADGTEGWAVTVRAGDAPKVESLISRILSGNTRTDFTF